MPQARTTIITVTYNSMQVLPQMLASLPPGTPTILVDNASRDTAALRDLAQASGAQLILNPDNRGFGVACNQGAALATTEFLLFLNPDAVLEPDTLTQLAAAADRFPKASAMNPRIVENDGAAFFKRKSTLMSRAERMPRGWPAADCEVPVLTGAALFARRADFNAVGGFDPAIFLFHEDDDLSRRLRAERGPIMFIRDAVIHHQGAASSGTSAGIVTFKDWHMGHSRVYTARKHHRPFARSGAILKGVTQLIAPTTLFSPTKRARQWAFLRGIIHASLGNKSTPQRPK